MRESGSSQKVLFSMPLPVHRQHRRWRYFLQRPRLWIWPLAWITALVFLAWMTTPVGRYVPAAELYRVTGVVKATSITALISICVLVFVTITEPQRNRAVVAHVALSIVVAVAGLKIGVGYVHLCLAGSRLLEGVAMFGTPILAGVATLAIPRRAAGVAVATIILCTIWVLQRPYLDWVHNN